jgi:hypothetical protein
VCYALKHRGSGNPCRTRGSWLVTVSNYFRTPALAAAAALTVLIVITLMTAGPAEAVFQGVNGKIAFGSFPPGEADSEIFTLTYNPGGAVPEELDPHLTGNTAQPSRRTAPRSPSRETAISG